MRGAFKTTLGLFIAIGCSPAFALDPNQTCAGSGDQLRETMMNESQVSRNILNPYARFINEPFSEVAKKVRKRGAGQFLEEAIMALDESKLCDREPPRCYTKREVIDLLRPTVKMLSSLPGLYQYLIFDDVRAIDYEPNLQKVSCHLKFWFDLDFFRQWLLNVGVDQATVNRDVGVIEQQTKMLRAIGKTYERKFAVQPNGRGGASLTMLPN
jgi:hypothetical protein